MKLSEKHRSQQLYHNKERNRWYYINRIVLPLIPFIGLVIIWDLAARNFKPDLLPSPMLVGKAFVELLTKPDYLDNTLIDHVLTSVYRVFAGFILAAFCAVPIGILLGWYKKVGNAFSPLIEILRTISPISWIPLAILWFGIGDPPAIFIITITAFFPILIATMHASNQVDPILLRVARNFGTRGTNLFRHLIIPTSLPYIIISLRISLGFSWVIIVAAEMVGMRSGLGYLISDARSSTRTDQVIAAMIVIGIIGYILDWTMRFLEKRFTAKKTHN